MKKIIDIIFIKYGVISVTAQIIFIRELMIIFGGNELSIGITLCSWLLGTAAGSFVFSKAFTSERKIKLTVSIIFILLAIILPLTLIFIRSIKNILNIQTGELVGIFSIAGLSLLFLLPFCFLSGALFPALSKLFHYLTEQGRERSVGRVYILEGAGAFLGGLLLNFFLIKHLLNFQISFLICFLCLLSALFILFLKKRTLYQISIIIIFSFTYFICLFPFSDRLEKFSEKLLWKNYKILESKNTVYGNIVVLEESNQRNFYENGIFLFSSSDIMSAEESVHFALIEHPEPKSILLMGGGINGGIYQAVKHKSIKEIDYIELDPAIIELGRKYLSKEDLPPKSYKNINIHNVDGRYFVKKCRKKYDCIIANFPDPSNALINRFYTIEFFREISKILNDGGIFSFKLTSSENYINNTLAQFFGTIDKTLKKVFEDIIIIPGSTMTYIASNQKGIITDNPDILIKRLKERAINTMYVSEFYLPFRMSKERTEYAASVISSVSKSELNKDFRPVGYYYNIVLWSTYSSEKIKNIFNLIYNLKYKEIFIFFILMLFCLPFLFLKKKKSIVTASYIAGFSVICLEVMLILGFQILYGYIYSKITIIIASFMGGLALGGWTALKIIKDKSKALNWLKKTQLIISFLPVILAVSFPILSGTEKLFHLTEIYLIMLIIISGFLGGCHFQFANTLYMEDSLKNSKKDFGIIYSADLLGSSIGALLISSFIIPLSGIFISCIYLFILNIIALILLTLYTK